MDVVACQHLITHIVDKLIASLIRRWRHGDAHDLGAEPGGVGEFKCVAEELKTPRKPARLANKEACGA